MNRDNDEYAKSEDAVLKLKVTIDYIHRDVVKANRSLTPSELKKLEVAYEAAHNQIP
jgi:hypothetical protein